MKAKDMIEYFSKFEPDAEVAIIGADPKARKKFGGQVFLITDAEVPVVCLEIHTQTDLDEEETEAAEQCEERARHEHEIRAAK